MDFKNLVRLVRPKHYLKNLLIFLPLVFSGNLFNLPYFSKAILSFLAFSLTASAVYVINDLKDKELDSRHPKKKNRPIASGAVSEAAAVGLLVLLIAGACVLQYMANFSAMTVGLLAFYLAINVLYSFGLKNVPILDVTILSIGFVIRVLYGGFSVGIEVSKWLYLAVLAFSFYLGLGKRRGELRINGSESRKVNQFYSHDFLDKNMYVFLGLTIVYYSLWTIDPTQIHKLMYLTIPLVIAVVMAYSLAVETGDSDGDPVSVVLSKKYLVWLLTANGALMLALVYLNP